MADAISPPALWSRLLFFNMLPDAILDVRHAAFMRPLLFAGAYA